ncbi:DUF3362 domain-containing protein, partial [bacterium]
MKNIKKIKHMFLNSGFRYDLLVDEYSDKYFEYVLQNHISGQMKVAPEHVSNKVLHLMNKPNVEIYKEFVKRFNRINKRINKRQFLVNYFISAHPGSNLDDAYALAKYCQNVNIQPEQIQDYTPLPMTISSCMYYTGMNPFTNKKVYNPNSIKQRKMQRALVQNRNPKNKIFLKEALKILKRSKI